MNSLQEPATWRELLGRLIADPREKEHLATAMRVRAVTLQRWADGINHPRLENIRALLKHIPHEIYPLFMSLLRLDFPELAQEKLPEEHIATTPPGGFYARALSNLALTPEPLYRQSMQELVLQQALEQLDPERQGLLISLATLVPPRRGNKARSLCELDGLGTLPWPPNLSEKLLFLGSESLVGQAVMHLRPFVVHNRDEITLYAVHWTNYERSAAAFPLLRKSKVVGGLIVASVQDFFFTPERLALIEAYSHLAACIFSAEEFLDVAEVELTMMPNYTLQLPYFAGYNRRVLQKVAEFSARGERVTMQKAREIVLQDLEEVLLRVFLQNNATHPTEQLR